MKKAFTLIELLVAVSMIVLVLGAAVSLEVQHIRSADANKHKLQADNLAQEALNLTRTIRDNNVLADLDTNNPFNGLNNGENCLIRNTETNKWELKAYGNCSAEEKGPTLDKIKYDIKVMVEDYEP